jgi:hypothetical protein
MNNEPYNELPSHIPHGEGKKALVENLKQLKDDYLTKGGESTDVINKLNDLENFVLYKRKLP